MKLRKEGEETKATPIFKTHSGPPIWGQIRSHLHTESWISNVVTVRLIRTS